MPERLGWGALIVIVVYAIVGAMWLITNHWNSGDKAQEARVAACHTLPMKQRLDCINPQLVIAKEKAAKAKADPPGAVTINQALSNCYSLANSQSNNADTYGICIWDVQKGFALVGGKGK